MVSVSVSVSVMVLVLVLVSVLVRGLEVVGGGGSDGESTVQRGGGMRCRRGRKGWNQRVRGRENGKLDSGYESTVGSAALRAILISMGGGAWYAMMAVTPESQGLNSPRTEDQRGNFPYRGLKASCLLFPCFPETGATFPYVNGDNMIIRGSLVHFIGRFFESRARARSSSVL